MIRTSRFSMTMGVITGILLLFISKQAETTTGDPDCCTQPLKCRSPDCSCCSEERYNVCQTQGRTSCEDDCKPGYHGGFCYNKCPDHCLTCENWELPNSRICLTCETEYHVAYRRCVPSTCPTTCLKCSNKTHCSECVPGHYSGREIPSGNTYNDCRLACPLHCTSCTSQTSCSRCEYGYYGAVCSLQCSKGCESGACEIIGNCKCKEGYSGDKCDACKDCQQCSAQCSNNACDTKSGTCLNGCVGNFQEPYCWNCTPNFTGETCASCISGWYGTNCIKKCPDKCVVCHQQTGQCEVCRGNFAGNTCNECKTGYYGDICNDVCSPNCVDNVCMRTNGTCSNGCISPYSGDKCCLNKTNCKICTIHSECSDCVDGHYGEACQTKCPPNCRACDKESGVCKICIGNYGGEYCRECKIGFYGHNCKEHCSEGCKNNTCDFINGTCLCNIDFFGSLCNKKCSSNCDINSSSNICEKESGYCLSGCLLGYYGVSCENKCNENCINSSCNQYNGNCTYGCLKGYEGATCISVSSDGNQIVFPIGLSVGSSVGGIIIVGMIVVLAIVFVKRLKNKNSSGIDNPLQDIHVRASTSTLDYHSGSKHEKARAIKVIGSSKSPYVNLANETGRKEGNRNKPMKFHWDDDKQLPTGTCIKKACLSDYVLQKNVDFFKNEFKNLPNGLQKSYDVSQLSENTARNRYRNVYPYDEYRVKLQGGQYGDYINASYIDGYGKEKAFIACLGPMKKHTEDFTIFWLMVWQQKVEMIVMVTNLIEELGKVKCDKYWPDLGTSEFYGDIVVACHSEDEYADFTIRSFTVCYGKENRRLYQIHFTAWPDKSVPHDVTSLIEFRNRVNSKSFRLTMDGPIIVHCSAGVGRTGTYIALDILTRQGESEGVVDIFRCVMNMRGQRLNMVQTWDQYRYLHYAVLHSLTFDPEAIPSERFENHLHQMTDQPLEEKFKVFKSIPADLSEDEFDAIRRNQQQITRNRMNVDIEGDAYRPRLYLGMNHTDNDYINAVYLNSYKQTKRFLITQTPMTETVIHFLTLLVQEKCPCIVSLDDPHQQDKSVGLYFPADNQQMTEGKFIISCRRLETAKNFILRKLTITARNIPGVQEHSVLHFVYTNWRYDTPVPETPESFVTLVRSVEQRVGTIKDTAPIVVHCMDAAERSGLFCAVSVLVQKEEVDHEVSVVNTLTHVRSRRSKAIPNKEQFKFCYQCVNAFLRSFDTYSNFV